MKKLGNYPLPNGWHWATIPELVGDDGVFIDGDWVESKDQDPDGDVRLIQLADVGDGAYRDRSARFLTSAKAAELRCTFLKTGDVLIARMPDPLGRACIYPGDTKPAVTVVDVCIVRSVNGEFDHRWLSWFVNASPVRAAISSLQAGSTRKRISRGNLATIPLPVPPPKEQRRIVAEIEKQFTRLDAGVTALRRVQANLKRYRAAVLKAACEGHLVPTEAELARKEGRTFETGEQLLQRILANRRDSWTGRGKYHEPISPDIGSLSSLPNGWTCASLEQITENFDGRRVPLKSTDRDKRPGQYPYYGASGIIDDIDDFLFDGEFLLIAEDGANLLTRSTPIAFRASGKFWVNNHAHIVQTLGHIPLSYLATFVNGKDLTFSVTGSAQPKLTQAAMNKISVPLPPLAEQRRIVAEVERRLSVIDELETVVTANLARATRLKQSVLQQSFSGKHSTPSAHA